MLFVDVVVIVAIMLAVSVSSVQSAMNCDKPTPGHLRKCITVITDLVPGQPSLTQFDAGTHQIQYLLGTTPALKNEYLLIKVTDAADSQQFIAMTPFPSYGDTRGCLPNYETRLDPYRTEYQWYGDQDHGACSSAWEIYVPFSFICTSSCVAKFLVVKF
jgi:hypothetical protein